MAKTVCELKYRDYIPYGWIAIEFCHLNFMGDSEYTYRNMWDAIAYDKFYKSEEEIKQLREQADVLRAEYESLPDDRTFFQKLIGSRNTPNCKLKDEIDSEINAIGEQLAGLGENRFYKSSELVVKAHIFLKEHGFLITNHSVGGDELKTHYEIWTREV